MQFTTVLAFAAGAFAVPKPNLPVTMVDLYMNSKCLEPDQPYNTIALEDQQCRNFDAGYGSVNVTVDPNVVDMCYVTLFGVKDCDGFPSNFFDGNCGAMEEEKPIWSMALTCLNDTAPRGIRSHVRH